MSKNEELRLIEEYFAIEDMIDERTIEVFKQRNKFGELTLDSFPSISKSKIAAI